MKYLIALAVALTLNAFANLLMKIGAKTVSQSDSGLIQNGIVGTVGVILSNPSLIIGLICFGLNAGFYMYALQSPSLPISIAYPIMVGGGYALIVIIAKFHPLLVESVNGFQWIGVGFVLLGILLITSQMSATSQLIDAKS